jgi:hypothetical protein
MSATQLKVVTGRGSGPLQLSIDLRPGKTAMSWQLITVRTITTQKEAPK